MSHIIFPPGFILPHIILPRYQFFPGEKLFNDLHYLPIPHVGNKTINDSLTKIRLYFYAPIHQLNDKQQRQRTTILTMTSDNSDNVMFFRAVLT